MHRLFAALVLVLALPVVASAQTVPDVNNPPAAAWTCSSDHATADGYHLDILRPDGSEVITGEARGPIADGAALGRDLAARLLAQAPKGFFDWR